MLTPILLALGQGVPADMPVERTDENSRLAHRQLVDKARKGRIDLYFVGDSITRRWGTSDVAYGHFLANWRENFQGWNAGNFGWGGDTTGNILWRIQHGELDGVNPKVIVVLAGTNNIGATPPDESKVADVVKGVTAIVDLCHQKARRATVVVTGVFFRGDNPEAVAAIREINRRLAKLGDRRWVRFVDVNDRLAHPDGRLRKGMAVDGLHLDVQGYQVWADGLKPILRELLGPPAKVDLSPPPTGDPSAGRSTEIRS